MQDNMSQEDVEKVEAFIQNELYGFKRSFCRDVHR